MYKFGSNLAALVTHRRTSKVSVQHVINVRNYVQGVYSFRISCTRPPQWVYEKFLKIPSDVVGVEGLVEEPVYFFKF